MTAPLGPSRPRTWATLIGPTGLLPRTQRTDPQEPCSTTPEEGRDLRPTGRFFRSSEILCRTARAVPQERVQNPSPNSQARAGASRCRSVLPSPRSTSPRTSTSTSTWGTQVLGLPLCLTEPDGDQTHRGFQGKGHPVLHPEEVRGPPGALLRLAGHLGRTPAPPLKPGRVSTPPSALSPQNASSLRPLSGP